MTNKFYKNFMKRTFDIIISLIVLVFFLPIFVLLVIVILLNLGRPVIYTQQRAGKNGKPFKIIKFKSMTNEKDDKGDLLPDELRLKKFGKLLRSTSLDELPEFLNILVGDMSLVGPRPLLIEYLDLYNEEQSKRHDVRPGLTGLAQVNGRNAISWEDKFELDVEYVKNVSFVNDLKICLKTVAVILKRSDISAEGEATVTKFTGSK